MALSDKAIQSGFECSKLRLSRCDVVAAANEYRSEVRSKTEIFEGLCDPREKFIDRIVFSVGHFRVEDQ
jgi:hypothetical protein